ARRSAVATDAMTAGRRGLAATQACGGVVVVATAACRCAVIARDAASTGGRARRVRPVAVGQQVGGQPLARSGAVGFVLVVAPGEQVGGAPATGRAVACRIGAVAIAEQVGRAPPRRGRTVRGSGCVVPAAAAGWCGLVVGRRVVAPVRAVIRPRLAGGGQGVERHGQRVDERVPLACDAADRRGGGRRVP